MKKYFIFAAAAIAMAACSNEDNEVIAQNDNAIHLSASVGKTTRAGNVAANLQNEQFLNGTTISVQIIDNAETSPITYPLATYTANGSGGLSTTTTQYYPASGSTVKAYAYHPANASTTFTVAADQTDDANYIASDLMYASLNPLVKSTTNQLVFAHKLSKLVVQLAVGTGFSASELTNAIVKLKGVNNQVTFAPATGETSAATGEADITVSAAAGTDENAAVVIPQDVAGKKIGVTIAGKEMEYTIPASTTFEAGKVNTYTITVAKTGLSVSSTITNWTVGVTVSDGSITF